MTEESCSLDFLNMNAVEVDQKKVYKEQSEIERNAEVCEKFQKALHSSLRLSNNDAVEYLKKRKINRDMIDKFSIGWCPSDANFRKSNNEHLIRLRGRLTFPIKDEYGDIASFSGRLPNTETNGDIKWWHESYSKSFFLYGLDVAYESILEKDLAIIVEGQIDAITCHRYGLTNTVACMGTAFTYQHIEKISRLTNNFILMFDGDGAGLKASREVSGYFDKYNDKFAGDHGSRIKKDKNLFFYKKITLRNNGIEYDPDEFLNKYGSDPIVKKIQEYQEERSGFLKEEKNV